MPRILTPADIADFRQRLCNVAAQLFGETGHDGFNMRELAKRLGVSAMTPYRYFADKDAILAEVRARAFANFADWLEDALARELPLADAYAEFAIREQIQYRLMFDLTQREAVNAAFAEAEDRLRAVMVAHAKALLARAHLTGDAELLGVTLWTMLHGVASLYLAAKIGSGDLHNVLSQSVAGWMAGQACVATSPHAGVASALAGWRMPEAAPVMLAE